MRTTTCSTSLSEPLLGAGWARTRWRLAGMSETAALNAAVPAADVSRRRRVSGLIASGYDRRPWRTRRREEVGDGAAVKLR